MEKRTCCRCKKRKSLDQFWVKPKGRKTGLCKPCKRDYNKDWYEKNKTKHIENVKKNNQRYRKTLRAFIDEKKAVPCKDCGKIFPPEAMDFDHLDARLKVENISRMVLTVVSVAKLQEEIDKCEVVCAICHRIRTRKRNVSAPLEGSSLS